MLLYVNIPLTNMSNLEKQKEVLFGHWRRADIVGENVLEAFEKIPREEFVLPEYRDDAYEDRPLPIPSGQTISQPTTVALMTEALDVEEGNIVLEVGAGSGYQAAILSKLVGSGHVYTTEIIPELVEFAKKNLEKLGIDNVTVVQADGSVGLPSYAPYDRIIVTAAAPSLPDKLVIQLKENGIIVIPVGSVYDQEMLKVVKSDEGLKTTKLGNFMFVKLKGEMGWD